MKDRTRSTRMTMVLAVLVLGLAACATPRAPDALPDDLPWNTALALSADGRQLVVARPLRGGRADAWLLTLDGTAVRSTRRVGLPKGTTQFTFDRDGRHLLVTTWTDGISRLQRVDPESGHAETLQQGEGRWSYPKRTRDGALFVLQSDKGRLFTGWQRFASGVQTEVGVTRNLPMGPLQEVQGTLFGIEATPAPVLTVLSGRLPPELERAFPRGSWSMACADTTPATCLRATQHKPSNGQYFGTLEVLHGPRGCTVAGQWIGEHSLEAAAGGTVAFVGRVSRAWDAPWSVYVAACLEGDGPAVAVRVSPERAPKPAYPL